MWNLLGNIGLILGIIVSVGSIVGYVPKLLPLFKKLQARNQQSNVVTPQPSPIQPSNRRNSPQPPKRNLLIPTVTGIILVSLFSFGIAFMNYHYDLYAPFLGIVTLNDVLVGFLSIIPLFLGVVYGFWVGFSVGGIGFFIGGTISDQVFPGAPGYAAIVISISFAIIGAVASLSRLKTQGQFTQVSNIIIANIIGAIGILISVCFVVYTMFILRHTDLSFAPQAILSLTVPEMLPGLIALPFLLLAYGSIVAQRRGAINGANIP